MFGKLLPVIAFLFLPAAGSTATLLAPDLSAKAGETVATTLTLSSDGQRLSGLQVDLQVPAALIVHAIPGVELGKESKWLLQGEPGPGVLRLLVIGWNGTTLADGELIRIFITVDPGSPAGPLRIGLSNPLGTTPEGTPIPLEVSPITVGIESGPPLTRFPRSGVLNAASLQTGAISPGEIITILGSVRSPKPSLRFNGLDATILHVSANQINAMVPADVPTEGIVAIELRQAGAVDVLSLPLASASPAIFTALSGGIGQGAVLNQDYSLNADDRPALSGSIVMIFGTGFGPLTEAPTAPMVVAPVTASVDNKDAQVIYAGAAPPLIPGLTQINVRLPQNLGGKPNAELVLRVGGKPTQRGVTISVR